MGGIILKWIIKKKEGGVYWIGLGQDRDRWQALVNALGPENVGCIFTS